MRRLHRNMTVAGLAVLLALVTATSAFAISTYTEGATGRLSDFRINDPDTCSTVYCLWASDALTNDTGCARWQKRNNTSPYAFAWYGGTNCSLAESLVATNAPDGVYRLCRTNYGNCGAEFGAYRFAPSSPLWSPLL